MKRILGISAYYHDSAAAIVVDGDIVAAAQEERFTRIKHDPSFPNASIKYCLEYSGLTIEELDAIVFYDKPFLKFERLLETYLAHVPRGFRSFLRAMPIWLKEKLYLKQVIKRELLNLSGVPSNSKHSKQRLPPLLFTEHHQSHAASAYYPSPFDEAVVVCLDGVGEWATTSIWHGKGNQLNVLYELQFPHSLGLLYSAFTYYCGFKVNSGEYKLMGLAPYGEPVYVDIIYQHLITVKADGSYALNLAYFDFPTGKVMTNEKFHRLFGSQPYPFDGTPDKRCMDIARSIQVVTEQIVLKIVSHASLITGCKNLCLAGGVALNCVANGKIEQADVFDNIFIQPAAGDAGGALGAALAAHYLCNQNTRKPLVDSMKGAFLGPAYSYKHTAHAASKWQAVYHRFNDEILLPLVAKCLAENKVVGWFQGRMEFGPRALGHRSILGDARCTTMQSVMNLKIKRRESFRPFAPIVCEEDALDYFDVSSPSPYMLKVARVKSHLITPVLSNVDGLARVNQIRSSLPAITHIDNTARLQTVSATINSRMYQLLRQFEKLSGTPVLINTSFNVRGEPIVCSPDDALRCFLATEMDVLVIDDCVFYKTEQRRESMNIAKSVTFKKD